MAKTLQNVRDRVRSFLDESSASDWTDVELNSYINARYHEMYTAVITTFEDYYLTTARFNTVADQEEYTPSGDSVPTDIYKLRRLEVNYDTSIANNPPTRAFPGSLDMVRRNLDQVGGLSGIRRVSQANYYWYGTGPTTVIGIIPVPNNSQTNAIKIWYVKYLTDLSSDSTALDLPYIDRYWMNIVYGAVSFALRQGQQDSAEAKDLENRFEAGLEKMKQELEDRVAEESKMVMDTDGSDIDFDHS